jgi:hypothetical protein
MMSPGSAAVKLAARWPGAVGGAGVLASAEDENTAQSAARNARHREIPVLVTSIGVVENKKAPALPRPNLATFWNDLLAGRLNCLKLLCGAFLPCPVAILCWMIHFCRGCFLTEVALPINR